MTKKLVWTIAKLQGAEKWENQWIASGILYSARLTSPVLVVQYETFPTKADAVRFVKGEKAAAGPQIVLARNCMASGAPRCQQNDGRAQCLQVATHRTRSEFGHDFCEQHAPEAR